MFFPDLNIKESYRTPDNIVEDFYIPLLSNAVSYDRAVGFFSSSVLLELSKGLINLVYNNGKMRLITSPKLREEDINAIQQGYDERKLLNDVLLRDWKEPKNGEEQERLNFLANLIADGILDIKIAFKRNGLYHEKIGILTDKGGYSVAFTGSLNESAQAMNLNFESIDTFTSWKEPTRVDKKKEYFETTWANLENTLDVIDFPLVLKEKLQSYKISSLTDACKKIKKLDIKDKENNNKIKRQDIEDIVFNEQSFDENYLTRELPTNVPKIPKGKELHDYQEKAIEEWENKNFRGIFDMATGTGKTYTGLGAITKLYNHLNGKLAVIICCPYIHLVDQWVEDIEEFNIEPIIGYGSSPQKNWKTRLKDAVTLFTKSTKPNFFCFISTNDTFRNPEVQDLIKKLGKNSLFISDEAHNFGAECLSKYLPNFDYRLALSATLNRHNDTAGTLNLYNYFGDKCIEYPLDRAINEGKLTRYFYYPHMISLDTEELEEYRKLSLELRKYHSADSKDLPDIAKKILIKRARILASAKNKIPELKKILIETGDYKKHNLLIYCGDSVVKEAELNNSQIFGEKQILLVCKLLGQDLNMDIKKFTSQESRDERLEIKEGFINKDYQAIVAIRCLDEGVNIPSIKTAYILASTTNPKEYIQRRGRVLRKYPGKDFSIIHDFIVLPCNIENLYNYSKEEFEIEAGLLKREIERMKEFAISAENSSSLYKDFIDPLEDLFIISGNNFTYEII